MEDFTCTPGSTTGIPASQILRVRSPMADPYLEPESDEETEYDEEEEGEEEDEEVLEDDEEEEEEEDDEEEGAEAEFILVQDSPRVSSSRRSNSGLAASYDVEDERDNRRRVQNRGGEGEGEGVSSCKEGEGGECSQDGSQRNRGEIEGLSCPICMDAWTSDGDHRICCLPCGHLFGLSCISRWLQQNGNSKKCPQCNRKCTMKDVRKLFAPRVAVIDEDSQKSFRCLEAKCASLEKKMDEVWCKRESEWQKREAQLQFQVEQLTERTSYLESLLGDLQNSQPGLTISGNSSDSQLCSQESSIRFILQGELRVNGARLFDIDLCGQILLIARRHPGIGGSYVLTKKSLLPPHETEDIYLPPTTKFIKDLHISPFKGSLVLCASLGKKLTVLSTESNNAVLSYNLPVPSWSCSWDLNSSNYMYAGLQNGLLLEFDIRQTSRPLESRLGLTTNPIHTICSLQHSSAAAPGARSVLSASSYGLCHWSFGGAGERPYLVPETTNQGVCISLSYCPSSDDIVASYRPRVETPNDIAVSQPVLTPAIWQTTLGLHLHLKRIGSGYQKLGIAHATVSDLRLPKSAITDIETEKPLLVAGDESAKGLILQELPSFGAVQRLPAHKHFICDVKFTRALSQGLLGCLSEDTLQLFRPKQ